MYQYNHRNAGERSRGSITRRTALTAGASAVAIGVAGCLDGRSPTPDPAALAGVLECDVCGMVIENHPGPNGQMFFEEEEPEGHDPPARFDSLKQCLFPYLLERRELGWEPTAIYVTDYSAVEYDVDEEGGTVLISSHTDPDSFSLARDLYYVVNSDVEGAMGPDFVPFGSRPDAEALSSEYGGRVLTYDEIDESVIGA